MTEFREVVAMDSREFVANLFAGAPESDRVAWMERYIHATFIDERCREAFAEYERFATRDPGEERENPA